MDRQKRTKEYDGEKIMAVGDKRRKDGGEWMDGAENRRK